MADSTIEWTDKTWNPVAGCTIISPGCTNCYAMRMAYRLEAMGQDKYTGLTRKTGGKYKWNGKIKLDNKSLIAPYLWKKPAMVFVNSMSDLFHENVPVDYIKQVWDVMGDTPLHTYQVLTKRADRLQEVLPELPVHKNIWLGVSVENADYNWRIDALRNSWQGIKFISFEPLLGPVGNVRLKNIDWAIVGGESGINSRPVCEEWIDEIHDACAVYDTAFFFKQWGAYGADKKKRSKKANGREYKGQTWNNMPSLLPYEQPVNVS